MPQISFPIGSLDAFDRLRTSDPVTVFDSQQQYDNSPLLWEESLTGSATAAHNAATAAVNCTVTTTSGDKVIRQTRQYHRYQPGKSHTIMMTFVLSDTEANLDQRVGYFDADNGIFLEVSGSTVSVVRRTKTSGSVVNNKVAQADWNADKFHNLDLTKAQIFYVSLEWLGVGLVECGFVIAGKFRPVHVFKNANALSTVYMVTANLPVRYEIEATGTLSQSRTLKAMCATVISEGGFESERGYPFAAGNGTSTIAVTTRRPVFSIRPKDTFNSIVNRGQIGPQTVSVYTDATALIEVVYNGSLTSASFASAGTSSITEKDVAASAISNGIVIDQFIVPASQQSKGNASAIIGTRLPLTLDIAGANPITLSVVATSFSGTANVSAAMEWLEYR